jgi:hypothetical protein
VTKSMQHTKPVFIVINHIITKKPNVIGDKTDTF